MSTDEQIIEELTHEQESSEQANKAAVTHSPASKEQTVDVTAPSPSTEESISAYIERTLATLGKQVDSPRSSYLLIL